MATREVYFREVQMAEHRINVNTATTEELTQLPGIGPVLAERIAAYRDAVRLFEEPAQITMVSGIGERTYRAIADRLAVAAPQELPRSAMESQQDPMPEREQMSAGPRIAEASDEEPPAEADVLSEEEISPEEGIEPKVRALPAGEPMLEEALTFAGETVEGAAAKTPQTDDVPEETPEDTPREVDDVPEEVIEGAPPKAQESFVDEEAAPEVEEEPIKEPTDAEAAPLERDLPPAVAGERPGAAPSPSWWRRLSWLWTALLGGLLGMAFALVVFSGVNGSLDVGHSRAVVDVRGRMNSLTTDINSLQGNVDGLRKRLDALEELTVRMDRVEATVGDLQEATVDLGQRADAVEEDVAAAVAELEAVSEQVGTLQEQAEQTRSFFQALQALLNDFFGEVGGEATVTPTPTPEGS
jgi:competence ComEA-like helix-hairpin-helix protein